MQVLLHATEKGIVDIVKIEILQEVTDLVIPVSLDRFVSVKRLTY